MNDTDIQLERRQDTMRKLSLTYTARSARTNSQRASGDVGDPTSRAPVGRIKAVRGKLTDDEPLQAEIEADNLACLVQE